LLPGAIERLDDLVSALPGAASDRLAHFIPAGRRKQQCDGCSYGSAGDERQQDVRSRSVS
jgi:hypothetical protein